MEFNRVLDINDKNLDRIKEDNQLLIGLANVLLSLLKQSNDNIIGQDFITCKEFLLNPEYKHIVMREGTESEKVYVRLI